MQIDPITVLNGCYMTALIIVILMPVFFPAFTAGILAAGIILKITWLLKFGILLYRIPSNRLLYKSLWRRFLFEVWTSL